ncbi:hypothetical protein DJ466_07410 [Staphylococcus pseudintermedius]|uniref:hypothetical protein n=1 Tax=Staphylococcus pseudintermedius TaxID=283734 RepID=UPI000C1C1493|nr:hypothetical protein [Staphylococcus pseudintermedius]TOY73225.1 hypothetical protein DJ466_07410 [Staphylococcus pseudintermedius]
MNELFRAVTLDDDYYEDGTTLKGFGVFTIKFSDDYYARTGTRRETYLYTQYNGEVKVDENSIEQLETKFKKIKSFE